MTIAQIYEDAKRKLDNNEITIGEFAKIVDVDVKQPKWIPVSERLPEDNDDVLVWCEWWDEDDFLCEWWSIGYYSYRKWKLKTPKRGIRVMAWMPVPAPFEPQES